MCTISGLAAIAMVPARALAVHTTSGTDDHGARTTSLNAAQDLFTAGSVQCNAVATAWSAVGVS